MAYTRQEIAEQLQQIGFSGITKRTIRYWTNRGWLPEPFKIEGEGNVVFYGENALEKARMLARLSPQHAKEIRNVIRITNIGGKEFSVTDLIGLRKDGDIEYRLERLSSGDVMLTRKRRD